MTEVEIPIPEGTRTAEIKRAILAACDLNGLIIFRETSLASYPGSIHWHLKKVNEKGTLELTSWTKARPLWATIHTGRGAPWMDGALPRLAQAILENIGSRKGNGSSQRETSITQPPC